MDPDAPDPAQPPPFPCECPNCARAFEADAADADGQVECPICTARFVPAAAEAGLFAPADAGEWDGPEGEDAERRHPLEDELSELRIRQLTKLRRASFRQRSFLIVGAAGCAIATVQAAINLASHVRRAAGGGVRPTGYALIAAWVIIIVGLLYLMARFARRAREIQRELDAPIPLPPAQTEPDFSTLSDGSQHWKNLEDIR